MHRARGKTGRLRGTLTALLLCPVLSAAPPPSTPQSVRSTQPGKIGKTSSAAAEVGEAARFWKALNSTGLQVYVGHVLDTRQGRESAVASRETVWHGPDCFVLDAAYSRLAESSDKASPTQWADSTARIMRFRARPGSPDCILIERETVLKQQVEGGESSMPDLQMLVVQSASHIVGNAGAVQQNGASTNQENAAFSINSNAVHRGGKLESQAVPDAVLHTGDFAILNPDARSAVGLFALRSELAMADSPSPPLLLHLHQEGAAIRAGYHFPLQMLPSGMRYRQTFLLAQTDQIAQSRPLFTRMQRELGLDGRPPAYKIEMEWGRALSTRYSLDLAAKENAVVVELNQTDLLCDLPFRIMGLQPRWAAVCAELPPGMHSIPLAPGALTSRPLGVRDGIGYAAVNLNDRAHRLFLGHPVICDRPDVEISVVDWNREGVKARFRNMAAQSMTINARIHPRLGFGTQTVRILPQASVTIQVPWR